VFGIVVTSGEEALAKGVVVRVEVRRRNDRIKREIDCRDGEQVHWDDHRNRCSLKVFRAGAVEEGMLDRGVDEDGSAATGGASKMICVIDGVEG
jgi:hypothetical protein